MCACGLFNLFPSSFIFYLTPPPQQQHHHHPMAVDVAFYANTIDKQLTWILYVSRQSFDLESSLCTCVHDMWVLGEKKKKKEVEGKSQEATSHYLLLNKRPGICKKKKTNTKQKQI